MPERDVESLLVSLILDNRIHGHIDQVNRLLERGDRSVNTIISYYFITLTFVASTRPFFLEIPYFAGQRG